MIDDTGDFSLLLNNNLLVSLANDQSGMTNNAVPEISSFYESEEGQGQQNINLSFEQQYEEMIKHQLGGLFKEYVEYKQAQRRSLPANPAEKGVNEDGKPNNNQTINSLAEEIKQP